MSFRSFQLHNNNEARVTKLSYRSKIDLGVAAGTIAIGALFAFEAAAIPDGSGFGVGPRVVPEALAWIMIGLGLLIGGGALMRRKPNGDADAPIADSLHPEPDEDFGFADSDLKRVAIVIGVGFFYIWLIHAFGYFAATAVAVFCMLIAFGNRNIVSIFVLSAVAAVVFQYVFMQLMGLYDAPGEIYNLKPYLEAIGLAS